MKLLHATAEFGIKDVSRDATKQSLDTSVRLVPAAHTGKATLAYRYDTSDTTPSERQSRAGCWVFASRCSETGTVDTRSVANVIPAFGAEARTSRKGKHRVSGNRRVMCRACQGGGPDPGSRVSVPAETKLTGAMGFPKAL